ncbi:hypothetical protein P9112_011937 [Eukaryota sp. TZLM1-RC]
MLNFSPLATWTPHTKGVTCTKFDQKNALIASSSADSSIIISNITTLDSPSTSSPLLATDLSVEHPRDFGVNSVDFSPYDSRFLVSGGDDAMVRIWDIEKQSHIRALEGHESWVLSVSFSPTGTLILSTSADESIRLWDARTSKPVKVLRGHVSAIGTASFSNDGSLIASGAGDGLIRIWDVLSGNCLQACMYEACPPVSSVSLSTNKAYVLGSFLDSSIRLVSIKDNTVALTYNGHVNDSYLLHSQFYSYKQADDMVLSGSEDGRLVGWNSKTGDKMADLGVYEGPLSWFDCSFDSKLVVASSIASGVLKLYSVE